MEEKILKYVYENGSGEYEAKKSRFIGQLYKVENEEEASEIISSIKKKYWDARHNCYAYVLGKNGEGSRSSDDGEPSGTAGRPILEVLKGENITNALLIVTRYFGGTLLGTGGLIKAYTMASKEAIENSKLMEVYEGKILDIGTNYDSIGKIQYIAGNDNIPIMDTEYGADVRLKMAVKLGEMDKLLKDITEVTKGQARIDYDEENVVFGLVDGQVIL